MQLARTVTAWRKASLATLAAAAWQAVPQTSPTVKAPAQNPDFPHHASWVAVGLYPDARKVHCPHHIEAVKA